MQTMNDKKSDEPGSATSSKTNTPSNGQSSLPSISVPKGGGAMRGIGEKFGVNPVTGTASASIPIFTSPGRSGFGPSLSLSYDSGMGNGPFGFGWNLPLPSITRKTEKGLPFYRDVEESDTFILSGSEDLVPELIQKDGQWQRNPSSRIVGNQEYHIQRYRPRIEGLFARIERWTKTITGETYWRSISKDNITTIYGKDEESRISDPEDPSRIFSWLICESYDDKGNAILYQYKEENSQGITLLIPERNREDTSRSTNRYLKKIKYGNKAPHQQGENLTLRSDWMFEVVFDYGEHYVEDDQGQPTTVLIRDDQQEWHIRLDPFSSYRPGFEVRTYRMCQRVLMFHHFPAELGVDDYLVRATEFTYDESPIASFVLSITQNGYRRLPDGSYLKRSMPPVEFEYSQAIIDEEIKEIDSKSLENLPYGIDGMHYQWVDLDGEGVSGILTEQGDAWFYKRNLGGGTFGPMERIAFKPSLSDVNGARQKLMDLAGNGQLDIVKLGGPTPGFYERNHDQQWENFVPFESLPNLDWNDPDLRLVDLTGDGLADILVTENEALTWYPALAKRGFGSSASSSILNLPESQDEERQPRLVFSDSTQSIYLADMSGDGLTDLVRIRNGEICYWPNLGYGRFGSKVTMDSSPWFDVPDMFDQSRIRLADIDGSGVTDIIYLGHDDRVRLYFNQSGNKWAQPVFLTSFPRIDNISSVMALDLLGNGTACLVWSSSLVGDTNKPLRYIDLMGGKKQQTGQNAEDSRGQKPHLLVSIKNNMGAETHVEYASSTKFYLADKAAGKPWITKLPFPVHVVERINTYDRISRNRFVTRYKYHHGYFDGVEREFRGFGMVEHYDTEEFGTLSSEGEVLLTGDNVEESTHVPPVYTKTWFHTGIYIGRKRVSNFFAGLLDADDKGEYYREPGLSDAQAQELLLADTDLPTGLSLEEEREACRALKGSMLRHEVYALDGTPKAEHPYTVSEQSFTIRRLQPQGNNQYAVFFAHAREAIGYHYERNPADPRISHSLTLEVDDFGNALKQASVGYGRRQPDPNSLLLQTDRDKQIRRLITYTENNLTNAIDTTDNYRTPLSCETRSYELTGYTPTGAAGRFQFADFVKFDPANPNVIVQIFDTEINYEDQPTNGKQRRLIGMVRTLYRPNDLGTAEDDPLKMLPLGTVESFALPGEGFKLAFTSGLLSQVFQRAGQSLLPNPGDVLGSGHSVSDQGGYVQSQPFKAKGIFPNTDPDDYWWIPTGRVFMSPKDLQRAAEELDYASKHFFLPLRYRDPFHTDAASTESFVTLDKYDLMMLEIRDPVDNLVTVGLRLPNGQIDPDKPGNDYRVLQPMLVTDPNRNRVEISFDALGMVAGSATKGKDDSEGDTLNEFEADLTQDQIDEFYNAVDPHVPAPDLLKGATSRVIYDLHRFRSTQEKHPEDPTQWLPVYGVTLVRESHVHINDPQPQGTLKIQISFSYSDGFGREIQKKMQAEPGPVIEGGDVVNPRWVCSGWTVFNNKGKPVRQYEPFFSQLPEKRHWFEFGVRVGVSPILFYDPAERVVATLHPDNTYEKVVFDPWKQVIYDVNDTVAAYGDQTGDPRTDVDIHGYTAKYFAALNDPTWQTWLEKRRNGNMPVEEQRAADKAAAHANTPTTAYLDTLCRPFMTMTHNRLERNGVITDETYATRTELDIKGKQREVRDAIVQNGDAQGRIVIQYDYDMVDNSIHQISMEAGTKWMLNDVAWKPIRSWDNRGHTFSTEYDVLRRPLRSFVIDADPTNPNQELLTERLVYGEQHPQDESLNLRGKLYLQLDQAGNMRNERHDFKGNLLSASRRLAKQYEQVIDWRVVDEDHAAFPINAKEKINPIALEAALKPLLEDDETFISQSTYDALNRPIQIIFPHSSKAGTKLNVSQPVYSETNLLERVDTWLELDAEPSALLDPSNAIQHFVRNIDYNAKGQRKLIEYGNGVTTTYDYDEATFRLRHLQTLRGGNEKMQDLFYFYDPAGNIVSIRDDAQQTIFFNGQVVKPDADYTYDAIYRLIQAIGREHIGQASQPQSTWDDKFRIGLPHPNDGQKMRNYLEVYAYDQVGNILSLDHRIADTNNSSSWIGNWNRTYHYGEEGLIQQDKKSNRLSSTTIGSLTEQYDHDLHGNIQRMPHLENHPDPDEPNMHWDFRDRLKQVDLGGGGTAYYIYDASGQRMRNVHKHIGALVEERIYLGNYEIYRKYNGNGLKLERETLHIMDDKQRIALVETRTVDNTGGNDPAPRQLIRYQYSNHLGSASLELDEEAQIISYEEYTPYGSTSYQGVRSHVETSKRYRYTGKERDEETGFSYHGARYYACWLGKWVSVDPSALTNDSKRPISTYAYGNLNPLVFIDPDGKDITVNPASQIKASEWVNMIKKSPDIPEYIKKDIKNKDNTITGPKKINQPKDTIPREWLSDLPFAFSSNDFEITTGQVNYELTITLSGIQITSRIVPDLQKGEFGPGNWIVVGKNEKGIKQKEWLPNNAFLTDKYSSVAAAKKVTHGITLSSEEVNKLVKTGEEGVETRLKSKRALIIIVNRFNVTSIFHSWEVSGSSVQLKVEVHELLNSFLHELGLHAGRKVQGKSAGHDLGGLDIGEVGIGKLDIDDMFPAFVTPDKVLDELQKAEKRLTLGFKAAEPPLPSLR
jgi:RHS repeat-associated protein